MFPRTASGPRGAAARQAFVPRGRRGRPRGAAGPAAVRRGTARPGRALTTNREADRIFAAGDGLGLRSDAIHATHPDAQRRLAAAIAATCDAASRERVDDGALLAVPRRDSLRSYQVLVAPAASTLARLFALTPATARLAAALAAGQTVAEYADAASITQGTARGYLKELFSRTGTGRQAELVRLLLSGIAQLERSDRGDPDA